MIDAMTRPITLRPWQVRAALAGRLRRIVVPLREQPADDWRPAPGLVEIHRCDEWGEPVEPRTKYDVLGMGFTEADGLRGFVMPYAPGDSLWGREVWTTDGVCDGLAAYRADGEPPAHLAHVRWRSPVTMPRWASRWTLTVGEARVCRVQDVTSDEAAGYGFDLPPVAALHAHQGRWLADHGPGAWAANPWCVSAAVETVAANIGEIDERG